MQDAIKELFIYSIYYDIVASFKMQDAIKEFIYSNTIYLFIRYICYSSIIQDARCNKRVI